MALQAVDGYGTSHPLGVYYLTAELTDISTASEAWVTVPHKGGGKVIRVEPILHGAITAADAVLTAEINGTAITGVSITVANSGSAATPEHPRQPTPLRPATRSASSPTAHPVRRRAAPSSSPSSASSRQATQPERHTT